MPNGRKTPLTITRVNIQKGGKVVPDRSLSFSAMLNPDKYRHRRSIRYDPTVTFGQIGSDLKFSRMLPDEVSFALVLDGTGVVPPMTQSQSTKEVIAMVDDLNKVVYEYEGSKHQPGRVRVVWGTLILFGRLSAMTINYTLFKPDGDPLRANIDLAFQGFMSKKESHLAANRSSPDLSHLVMVRDGDTLPLLCRRIYGDEAYYPQVARVNGLASFRKLEPGRNLIFPPLD